VSYTSQKVQNSQFNHLEDVQIDSFWQADIIFSISVVANPGAQVETGSFESFTVAHEYASVLPGLARFS